MQAQGSMVRCATKVARVILKVLAMLHAIHGHMRTCVTGQAGSTSQHNAPSPLHLGSK